MQQRSLSTWHSLVRAGNIRGSLLVNVAGAKLYLRSFESSPNPGKKQRLRETNQQCQNFIPTWISQEKDLRLPLQAHQK